jgi:hypothetical protein
MAFGRAIRAERYNLHSHAEHGNEDIDDIVDRLYGKCQTLSLTQIDEKGIKALFEFGAKSNIKIKGVVKHYGPKS